MDFFEFYNVCRISSVLNWEILSKKNLRFFKMLENIDGYKQTR